ncbi:MAG: F0F1 ATP synthase subunit A [Deltaproteobacteria bacterium]|nr:F0F1 ATP synthase subunit A [Deltaproteobacteria bacterium]
MVLSSGHDFGWIPWIAERVRGVPITDMTAALLMAGVVGLLLCLLALRIGRRVRNPETYLVPDRRVTLTALFDAGVDWLAGLAEEVMGAQAKRHLPFLGSVFFYILISNLCGLIPGFLPATSNLNINLAIGFSVFFYYHYMGIRAHGVGPYLKHFAGPLIWIAPLFFVIELVSHVVRPLSLSIRLFGNMTVDHAVLGVFTELTKVIIPVAFLGLGLFVCLVQAFVFTLLSMVYIALAEAHAEESHH